MEFMIAVGVLAAMLPGAWKFYQTAKNFKQTPFWFRLVTGAVFAGLFFQALPDLFSGELNLFTFTKVMLIASYLMVGLIGYVCWATQIWKAVMAKL